MSFANVGGGVGGVEPSERLLRLAKRVLWVICPLYGGVGGVELASKVVAMAIKLASPCQVSARETVDFGACAPKLIVSRAPQNVCAL